jgi:hypothetical protein
MIPRFSPMPIGKMVSLRRYPHPQPLPKALERGEMGVGLVPLTYCNGEGVRGWGKFLMRALVTIQVHGQRAEGRIEQHRND